MSRLKSTRANTARRAHRVRTAVKGDSQRPRLSVHVSNRHISAQLIDDSKQLSITSVSSDGIKATGTMSDKAAVVGAEIAKRAKAKKIKKVAFDRGSRLYHGRVKALADSARKEGLEF